MDTNVIAPDDDDVRLCGCCCAFAVALAAEMATNDANRPSQIFLGFLTVHLLFVFS